MPDNLVYVIQEFDYRTGAWLPVEVSDNSTLAWERFQWHIQNIDFANHRLLVAREIPAQPW